MKRVLMCICLLRMSDAIESAGGEAPQPEVDNAVCPPPSVDELPTAPVQEVSEPIAEAPIADAPGSWPVEASVEETPAEDVPVANPPVEEETFLEKVEDKLEAIGEEIKEGVEHVVEEVKEFFEGKEENTTTDTPSEEV